MKKSLFGVFIVLLVVSGVVLAMGERPKRAENVILKGKLIAASLKTEGLFCPSCEIGVKNSLMKLEGMTMALVSYKDNRAVIFSEKEFSKATLAQAVEKAGFKLLSVSPMKSREIKITAQNFKFIPNEIILEAGRPIKLIISSPMGRHNIDIHDFGIEEDISAGDSISVEFVPLKKGEFGFYCNIPGHKAKGMTGKIIVK